MERMEVGCTVKSESIFPPQVMLVSIYSQRRMNVRCKVTDGSIQLDDVMKKELKYEKKNKMEKIIVFSFKIIWPTILVLSHNVPPNSRCLTNL